MSRALSGPRMPHPWNALVGAVLERMPAGALTVRLPDGAEHRFLGAAPGPSARIDVRDPSLSRRLVTGGEIAFAEGYMDGSWDTPDLDALMALGAEILTAGWLADVPVPLRPLQRAWNLLRDNDLAGARRNIRYHYDLGNDFYELWLDETMTYSSACFAGEDGDGLECAQRRKWDRVLELIQPAPDDHILEIGCGWGGFALHAAKAAGCRVTGLTLSEQQAAMARLRVESEGLEDQVDIQLRDYREETGRYRGIASIEMFEAVGERWWPAFFGKIRSLLEPGRAAGIQVITRPEDGFEDYRRSNDFIRRYIFPGGMLPSPERFAAAARVAGLKVEEPRFFGRDYERTLATWADRFESALPRIRAMGFDERFVRMWRYYLASCRAAFGVGGVDVMQVRLVS